jgi:hypothetical protein
VPACSYQREAPRPWSRAAKRDLHQPQSR